MMCHRFIWPFWVCKPNTKMTACNRSRNRAYVCVCVYMFALGVGRCDDKKYTQRLVYDSHYHFIVCVSGTQGKRIKIHRPRQIYNQYYNIMFYICCLNFNIASWCIDTNMNLHMRHGTKRRITPENFLNIEINFIVFTKRPDYDS